MDPSWKIYISGHRGMVGSALVRKFQSLGYGDIETATRDELDAKIDGLLKEISRL